MTVAIEPVATTPAAPAAPRANPYVGPRSFRTGERLYGRDYEAAALLDLLIAERIVVLYSPSGAGKTSLVQAMLIPALEDREFRVLPVIRVSTEPPAVGQDGAGNSEGSTPPAANRYLLSALLSLEEQLMPDEQRPVDALAALTLDSYLQGRPRLIDDGRAEVLIFDQFEEILTIDPFDTAAKQRFFEQVGAALRNKNRWALFSMREEFIAGLDPYLRPVPTRFANTFRLDLLGIDAARTAIQQPARAAGVTFQDAAADKLLGDLRSVKVQVAPGVFADQPGPYIEPVQLQVVCHRLWERLPASDTEITETDVRAIGSVDDALGGYYDAQIAEVAEGGVVPERAIRDWFDRTLITPQDIRSQVMQGQDASGGLPNGAIFPLIDAHLVRSEKRRGINWFELAHDRLIKPVKRSNAHWREHNLQPFQRQAVIWNDSSRPDGLLLRDQPLQAAEDWIAANKPTLTADVETPFLEQSQRLRSETQRTRRNNRIIRWLLGAALVSLVVALGGGVLAIRARNEAVVAKNRAESERSQNESSRLAAVALDNLRLDPERSVLLSLAAYDAAVDVVPNDTFNALQASVQDIKLRRTLQTDQQPVVGAALSPDSALTYALSKDGTLRVYDASGVVVRSWVTHPTSALSLALSPDGQTVLTSAEDGGAALWRAQDGTLIRRLPAAGESVPATAFSPDGKRFALGDQRGGVRVFLVDDATPPQEFRFADDKINAVAFDRTSTLIAAAGDRKIVYLRDLQNGSGPYDSVPENHDGPIRAVAFSPTADLIATGSDDRTIKVWNVRNFTLEMSAAAHSEGITALAFSPDGQRIASASTDATAIVWDVQTGNELDVLVGHTRGVGAVVFDRTNTQVMTASADGSTRVWHVPPGHVYDVYSVDVSPDGKTLVTTSADGTARVWDPTSGDVRGIYRGHAGRLWIAEFRPGRNDELLTAGEDGSVQIWSPQTLVTRLNVAVDSQIYTAAWSPDGTRIAAGDDNGRITIWDSQSGDQITQIQAHRGSIFGVAWSPDGSKIATGATDDTAVIWDVSSGTALHTLAHEGDVSAVAFSPDGQTLATASYDNTARLWDVQSGQERAKLIGHDRRVNAVTFNADGSRLATGADDQTVKIWDVTNKSLWDNFTRFTSSVYGVRFTPDGSRVLTASGDGRLRTFVLDVNELARIARSRVSRQLRPDERCNYVSPNAADCTEQVEQNRK